MKPLSTDEIKWLSTRFPKLIVSEIKDGFAISGDLIVDMFYDESSKNKYIIFPEEEIRSSNWYIHDVYQVRADCYDAPFIPEVYETAGRIKAFAQRKNIPLCDLHVNDLGNLCLCPKPLENITLKDTYTIQDFFTLLMIPFFYAQSYYEKNNQWPWKDYSHGDSGILECYVDHISEVHDKTAFIKNTFGSLNLRNQQMVSSSDQITRQSLCVCGSGKKFRNCHYKEWKAIKILKEDSKKLKINFE